MKGTHTLLGLTQLFEIYAFIPLFFAFCVNYNISLYKHKQHLSGDLCDSDSTRLVLDSEYCITYISSTTNCASFRPEQHIFEVEFNICVDSWHGK